MPAVSVVMSVKNEEKYLEYSILSILKQSFTDFEFIVVDDGSSDNSKGIITKFSETDDRVKPIFLLDSIGLPAALNRGLSLAQGKYIARMDGDDEAYPDRIKIQKEFLDQNTEIHVCGTQVKVLRPFWFESDDYEYPLYEQHDDIQINFLHRAGIIHPSVMFRSVIAGVPVRYDENFTKGQDYELWTRLSFQHGAKFCNIPLRLLRYRARAGFQQEIRVAQEKSKIRIYFETASRLGLDGNDLRLFFLWAAGRLRSDSESVALVAQFCEIVVANSRVKLFDHDKLIGHLRPPAENIIKQICNTGMEGWLAVSSLPLAELGITRSELRRLWHRALVGELWRRVKSLPVLGLLAYLFIGMIKPDFLFRRSK